MRAHMTSAAAQASRSAVATMTGKRAPDGGAEAGGEGGGHAEMVVAPSSSSEGVRGEGGASEGDGANSDEDGGGEVSCAAWEGGGGEGAMTTAKVIVWLCAVTDEPRAMDNSAVDMPASVL